MVDFSDEAQRADAAAMAATGPSAAAVAGTAGAVSDRAQDIGQAATSIGDTGTAVVARHVTPVTDAAADTVGAARDVIESVAGAAIGVASMLGAHIPASLTCVKPPNIGFVPFDFNPEKITMSRTSTTSGMTKPQRPGQTGLATGPKTSGTSGSYLRNVKASKIALAEVVFEGPFTKLRCDTLLTWMNPSTGLFAMVGGIGNFATAPAPLTFVWGPPMVGFMYDVKLTSCRVVYERFTPAGIPIRAKISLEMEEVPSILGSLPTNPTSGGLPGRRAHTVADGESLQSIAVTNYGTPALWRRIAEVNRIQNPSRVRPGTVIYLPNADELTTKARS
ncbi:LysM peptidoglycan-binding domain-containing protein [Actinophytocola sediminis]